VLRHEAIRIAQLKPSWGVEFANSLLAAKDAHEDLCSLNDGEFDLSPPQAVIDATREALARGKTRYDEVKGLRSLREGICAKLRRDDGIAADPDEILVTNGSSQVIFEIFQCYLSPGDRVLIPMPAWPTYEQGIRLAGGIPVGYPCLHPELDLDHLRRLAEGGAKMLVINSPHNPTGIVLSRNTMERLVALAAEFDMLILSDEAYDGLLHHSVERVNTRSVGDAEGARILTTRSFSKCYSMTGFRIGYLHASREIVDRCAALHAHLSDNVCTFAQFGAAAALELPDEFVVDRASILQARLETAYELISPVLPCPSPRGGFYLFPDLAPVLGRRWVDAPEFVVSLLQETGVATLPGDAFGCSDHFRISVAAVSRERTAHAMGRILDFICKQA
jgi:aspartate aminotransferase